MTGGSEITLSLVVWIFVKCVEIRCRVTGLFHCFDIDYSFSVQFMLRRYTDFRLNLINFLRNTDSKDNVNIKVNVTTSESSFSF